MKAIIILCIFSSFVLQSCSKKVVREDGVTIYLAYYARTALQVVRALPFPRTFDSIPKNELIEDENAWYWEDREDLLMYSFPKPKDEIAYYNKVMQLLGYKKPYPRSVQSDASIKFILSHKLTDSEISKYRRN